jgi:uncharacterized protein (DUF2147 family)
MRLRLSLSAGLLAALPLMADASPVGRWWTEDRSGVIEITRCGQALCGRIVGQTEPRDARGNISRDIHGVPDCGLTILHDARQVEPGRWRGRITNPDDGQDWRCEIWVGEDGALRLRGYVVVPLLGQTQVWPPFHGQVAADCTIAAGSG